MISNIENQILALFYTMALAYFVGIIAMYYEKEVFLNNDEIETDSDTDEETDIVIKEPIKYEDNYLEKYRAFNDKFMYSQDDYETEYQKYEELIFTNKNKDESGELNLEDLENIQKESCDYMHNQFLLKLKNSYVMEHTPLGNVAMCYNHEKETFEYYSDKIIPYRYLEPVARKYVMFFHCKQLYVDMDEELKLQQEKIAKEEAEKEAEKERVETITTTEPPKKELFAKLKSYNKETTNAPSNYKNNKLNPLPNYMKPIISQPQNQNQQSSKALLKENANRYTHNGRFSNFMILKTVNRNVVDKKYALSYKDYKMISK